MKNAEGVRNVEKIVRMTEGDLMVVVSAMGKTTFAKMKEDLTLPVKLDKQFKPYIVTNLTVDEIAWLATEFSSYELNIDTIYSLEGETKMGEQFEEFYPDKDALKRLMFELFYHEVEP